MKVLVHYTTQKNVYNYFSRSDSVNITKTVRVEEISNFYRKYYRFQESMFFLVCFYSSDPLSREYTAGKVSYNENDDAYLYSTVSDDLCTTICVELGMDDVNTYDKEVYYKTYTIEETSMNFMNKNKSYELNKIRLKFFSWDELFSSNGILFKEVTNIIFNRENVLKVASTYKPNLDYSSKIMHKKYFDALKAIGFIAKNGIDVDFNTLHGDIGEFLMHVMLSEFLHEQSQEKYIYPKLVFKSSPKMPVYGNDGTIYVKDKKEIYYLEAKFYSGLNEAINKAVSSLEKHNETSEENINHKIELFRNIKTDALDEIIEIDDETNENLVIFVICDSHTKYDDILQKVRTNKQLKGLKTRYNVLLFVLPLLSKDAFLKYFRDISEKVWEDINEK